MYIQSDSDDLESVPLALLRRDVGTSDEVGKGSTTDDEVCVNCLHRFQLIVCISSVYLRDAER